MADRVYLTDIKRDMAEGTHAAKHTRYFHDIHTHDFYNIAWVEHGGFDYMVDTKNIMLRTNQSSCLFLEVCIA